MTGEDGMTYQHQLTDEVEISMDELAFYYDESIREPRECHDNYNLLARVAIQQMINPATLRSQ